MGIDLERKTISENQLGVMRPDQILQLFKVSPDFQGHFVVLSRKFLEEARIDFKNALSILFYFKNNPCPELSKDEMDVLLEYVSLLKKKMNYDKPEYRYNVIIHLINAMFYEVNMIFVGDKWADKKYKNRSEELFERFMVEVRKYYKQERKVSFYADKLCLTPKYLSSAIKDATGKLAGDWIDDCVILEAKTLIKNSGMTIQQIAEELNFANQSFFGKYFKHHTGMSPLTYKMK